MSMNRAIPTTRARHAEAKQAKDRRTDAVARLEAAPTADAVEAALAQARAWANAAVGARAYTTYRTLVDDIIHIRNRHATGGRS